MIANAENLVLYRLDPQKAGLPGPAFAGMLVQEAVKHGWQGNLWHCWLTHLLAENENPFSLACERCQPPRDSLWQLAKRDMEVFLTAFRQTPELPGWEILRDFRHEGDMDSAAEAIVELSVRLAEAKNAEAMLELLTALYRDRGLGMLGLGQVFRLDNGGSLYPAVRRRPVRLCDIVGYDEQKKALSANTLAFLRGKHANNVLLYGDAGTGKSTSIQALAEEYAPQGLRLIELYKHQFSLIPDLFARIKNRNYRFILLLDDLSFEENEVEYKYLKAVLEGGAEAAPENIRVYATSNRRHLIRETWNDRSDMEHNADVHRSDTMEEKLSLSARFGLQIFYPNPTFEEYHTIVRALAKRENACLSPEQLRAAASTWQVRCGSRSGRTARQFVDSLSCLETSAPEGKEYT